MKRILWLGLAAALVATGAWFARAAWRAHKNLITLHVRNAPLAEVVRQLERQTRETILLDRTLAGSLTLDLDNVPLVDALGRVAEQVGGLPGAIHTVYHSPAALRSLRAALAAGGKPDRDTWTNLAPNFNWAGAQGSTEAGGSPNAGVTGAAAGSQPRVQVLSRGDLPPEVRAAVEQAMKAGGGEAAGPRVFSLNVNGKEIQGSDTAQATTAAPGTAGHRQARVMTIRLNANDLQSGEAGRALHGQLGTNANQLGEAMAGAVTEALGTGTNGSVHFSSGSRRFSTGPVVTMMSSGSGADGETDSWSPERIILEQPLLPRLGNEFPNTPSRAAAEAVAAKVKGECRTLYALQKSPAGPLPAGLLRQLEPARWGGAGTPLARGSNAPPALDQIAGEVEARIRREALEQYQNLTPEQRAERARDRQAAQHKP